MSVPLDGDEHRIDEGRFRGAAAAPGRTEAVDMLDAGKQRRSTLVNGSIRQVVARAKAGGLRSTVRTRVRLATTTRTRTLLPTDSRTSRRSRRGRQRLCRQDRQRAANTPIAFRRLRAEADQPLVARAGAGSDLVFQRNELERRPKPASVGSASARRMVLGSLNGQKRIHGRAV